MLGPGAEVRLELDIDVWAIEVLPNHFDEVLLNLATNARDAMPEGRRLSIATRNLPAASPARREIPKERRSAWSSP